MGAGASHAPSGRGFGGASTAGILCLAGAETTGTVRQVAQNYGLPVTAVTTLEDAMAQIPKGPWMAVVAALGTRRGVDLLFDRSGRSESSLILAAKQLEPPHWSQSSAGLHARRRTCHPDADVLELMVSFALLKV